MERNAAFTLTHVLIAIACITEVWCLDDTNTTSTTTIEPSYDNNNSTTTTTTTLPTTTTTTVDSQSDAIVYNTTLSPGNYSKFDINPHPYPPDCSQRDKLSSQPVFSASAKLRKCCPLGEGLSLMGENQSQQMCDSTHFKFNPTVIDVEFYDNCIEDTEKTVTLPLEIGNPCNTSLLYNSTDDVLLYIIQNGSILIMDANGNQSYKTYPSYCVDVDNESQGMYAFVCITSVEEHLKRSQIMLVAILMLISIPCLLIVSYLHCALNELRTLHGLSLSLMSSSLAAGYFLHSIAHIYNINSTNIGYAIQFFLLSFYFWYLLLCCNILLSVWYTIPFNRQISKNLRWATFAVYCLISFSFPILLVVLTKQKGLPGMPSYFIQGYTQSIRESQRYFIPPVSTILFLSFIVMAISFFGFQRIKKRNSTAANEKNSCLRFMRVSMDIDQERYDEVKKNAKCISLLGIIMIITWMLEIVTFYSPGDDNYLIVLEMINGLQGVFILLIFLVVRRRRTVILRWWYDRGSHNVEQIEEELVTMPLNKP